VRDEGSMAVISLIRCILASLASWRVPTRQHAGFGTAASEVPEHSFA
jgi:hypothetical protein